MKRLNAIKYIASGLIFAVLNVCSVATSAETIVGDNNKNPPPANADEILKNLRDIIAHGDLADVQYYSEKLGVVLKGSEIGEMYFWGPVCGKIKTNRLGQYFNNLNVPWYFDNSHIFNAACGSYPYKKELLQNGLVQVSAYIYIDERKVCITPDDVENNFQRMDYSHGPNNRKQMYVFKKENSIYLIVLSLGEGKCVGIINLFQNDDEDTLK